jgi:raffinose/stachyose/melibiose transport system permease protein
MFSPEAGMRRAAGTRSGRQDRAATVTQYLFQSQFTTNFNVAFASYLMALLPTLVAFLIAQRWIVSGIMRGSIK